MSMPKYDCEKYYRIISMTQLNYANQLKRLSKNQSRANTIMMYYSTALIVYSVASIIYPMYFSLKWMEFSGIILSIVVLLYSIVNGNANYPQRITSIEKALNRVKSLKREVGSIHATCCYVEKCLQSARSPIGANNEAKNEQCKNTDRNNLKHLDSTMCKRLERIKRKYDTIVATTEIRDNLDFYYTIIQLCAKYNIDPYAKPEQIRMNASRLKNDEIVEEIIGYISENSPRQQRRYIVFLTVVHILLYIAPIVILVLGIAFNGRCIHISFS